MIHRTLSDITPTYLEGLAHGTKIEFHYSTRTRTFAQAWVIDREQTMDRPYRVHFGPRHLVGWFGDEYVTPTLEHMACPPWPEVKPVTDVRVFTDW